MPDARWTVTGSTKGQSECIQAPLWRRSNCAAARDFDAASFHARYYEMSGLGAISVGTHGRHPHFGISLSLQIGWPGAIVYVASDSLFPARSGSHRSGGYRGRGIAWTE